MGDTNSLSDSSSNGGESRGSSMVWLCGNQRRKSIKSTAGELDTAFAKGLWSLGGAEVGRMDALEHVPVKAQKEEVR